MQLTAFLKDVFSYLAPQFADKLQLNSRANGQPDKPGLDRAPALATKTILQLGMKNAKLLVLLGVDVFSPCAVTLQGDYV